MAQGKTGQKTAFGSPKSGRRQTPTPHKSRREAAPSTVANLEARLAEKDTVLRETAADLRAERDFIVAVLDTVPVLLVVRDVQGRIVRFNRLAEELSGIDSEDAIGKSLWELVLAPDEAEAAKAHFMRVVAGESPERIELHWRHRDGDRRTILWRATRVEVPRDETPYVVAIGQDITDQRLAEMQARNRLDELATLYRIHTANELAATLSHELNQPLAAISSLSDATLAALKSGAGEPDRFAANLTSISEQALRAGRYINELRRFVSQGEVERATVDLNAVMRSACTLAASLALRNRVRILLALADELAPVEAAEIQIEHVVTNLLRNAIEAIAAAGLRSGEVRVSTRATPEGMACVSVTDNGPGLGADHLERLFEPFFSTKSSGLGMGLRVSRTIVEAHGGRLWAEAGQGGNFSFTLPFAR